MSHFHGKPRLQARETIGYGWGMGGDGNCQQVADGCAPAIVAGDIASAILHLREAIGILDAAGKGRAAVAAHHALALVDPRLAEFDASEDWAA